MAMPQQEEGDRACLVRLETSGAVEEYLASTPGTRRIANDPLFLGVDYTSALRQSCADVLRTDAFGLDPRRFGSVDLVALCERRLAAIAAKAG